jgi:NAD(P)-dependent dehydrogenase (short-subunit alcohol dehydrogenase family)
VTTQLDVTSDVDRVVDRIVEEQGRLDCLVNNAGFGQMGPVEDVPVDKVAEQYDVNVFGPHRLMRAVLPQMRDRNSGTIVNVTTITDAFATLGEKPIRRERRVTDGLLAERAQFDAGTMDENPGTATITAAIDGARRDHQLRGAAQDGGGGGSPERGDGATGGHSPRGGEDHPETPGQRDRSAASGIG